MRTLISQELVWTSYNVAVSLCCFLRNVTSLSLSRIFSFKRSWQLLTGVSTCLYDMSITWSKNKISKVQAKQIFHYTSPIYECQCHDQLTSNESQFRPYSNNRVSKYYELINLHEQSEVRGIQKGIKIAYPYMDGTMVVCASDQEGILKGEVSFYCWPPVWISLICK
jgi:hypothetical protein